MKKDITNALICPHCASPLTREGNSILCEHRHTYDIAKSGYVNLHNTSSKKQSGDSKEMAASRTAFLDTGAYSRFMEEIRSLAGAGDVLVDAGCGEGYYTVALSENFEHSYGFDLSRDSVMTAAKRAKASGAGERCFFGVASVYSIPIANGAADCVTNIFAPCVEEEYCRMLKDGGILIVACAGTHHLEGLKAALYEQIRENTDRADLPKSMKLIEKRNVSYNIVLDSPEMIRNLYMMTPYCYKTSIDAQKKLLSLDSLETVVDFDIYVYSRKESLCEF